MTEMMKDKNSLNKYKNLFAPVSTFIFLLSLFSYASWFTLQYEIELEQKKVSDKFSLIASHIETLVNQQIDIAQGLAIYQKENPNLSFSDLTLFSEKLFASQTEILKTVVLTTDTTVTFIYPLKGNESVLGVDLATVPNQKDVVLQVKRSLRTVISQPLELIQGGVGVICRIPLTTYKNGITEDFSGLMNVVIDYNRLLGNSGVLAATRNYQINIYNIDESMSKQTRIFYSSEATLDNPVELPIILRENNWLLEVAPIEGWAPSARFHIIILLIGLVTSSFSFFYIRTLLSSKDTLNKIVKERTRELETTLENLNLAQEQLIQSEKLAALGQLVSGVAHEINTPLGNGIVLTSLLQEKQKALQKLFNEKKLTQKALSEYLSDVEEATTVIDSSLSHVAEIVSSFKTFAIEHTSLEIQSFNFKNHINSIILSLPPKFKNAAHQILLSCDENVDIIADPGAIAHIMTQLISNSYIHAFENTTEGHIKIDVTLTNSILTIDYSDDGAGIPKELLTKVFNPFFTTRKDMSGTGLGLHIVHHLVTKVLNGNIVLTSQLNHGAQFHITFPIQ